MSKKDPTERETLERLLKATEKFWMYVQSYSDPGLEVAATVELRRARNLSRKVLGLPPLDKDDPYA